VAIARNEWWIVLVHTFHPCRLWWEAIISGGIVVHMERLVIVLLKLGVDRVGHGGAGILSAHIVAEFAIELGIGME